MSSAPWSTGLHTKGEVEKRHFVVMVFGVFVKQSLHSRKQSRSHFMVALSNNDGQTKTKVRDLATLN